MIRPSAFIQGSTVEPVYNCITNLVSQTVFTVVFLLLLDLHGFQPNDTIKTITYSNFSKRKVYTLIHLYKAATCPLRGNCHRLVSEWELFYKAGSTVHAIAIL